MAAIKPIEPGSPRSPTRSPIRSPSRPSSTPVHSYTTHRQSVTFVFIATVIMSIIFFSETRSYFRSNYSSDPNTSMEAMTARSMDLVHAKEPEYYSKSDLDFAVIGFPKTGTSFLMNVLENHKEIKMILSDNVLSNGEFCEIHHSKGDKELLQQLKTKAYDTEHRKYGIKCPTMVRNTNAIDNLAKISSHYTRLVVGVRHPALWFQSFFNYRVMFTHLRNESLSDIPNPNTLTSKKQWQDVSTSYARFDVYLKQFAKVQLSQDELKDMLNEQLWKKEISPTKFKIFIYTVEQLNDKNSTRQARFRHDLQEFLRLDTPFPDFDTLPTVNENHEIFPEYVDLCKPEFEKLRKSLLEQGKKSSQWISNRFIHADDVVVSNMDHFKSVLETWGQDPCKKE